MRRLLFLALIALFCAFGTCSPVWASGFVKWADSTYKHTMTDSVFWWNKYDTTFTDVNTGDTLYYFTTVDTLKDLPTAWITIATTDTTYHFCHTGDSIIWPADTTIVNTWDTVLVAADTTILTAADLVRQTTQWTFIEGITDSLVSEPFSMTSGENVWTKSALIGLEILDGTTDSMFVFGKVLMASSPICGSLPDSEFAYDYATAEVVDSNDAPGIGSPTVVDLAAPPSCGKVVLNGYSDNAVATPAAHYRAGSAEGTKVRVWVYTSSEPMSSYQQDSDTTSWDITKTQAASTYSVEFTITDPKNLLGDSVAIWSNETGHSITLLGVSAWATDDDFEVILKEFTNAGAAAGGSIDTITIADDGTNCYYTASEVTALDHATIEDRNCIWYVASADTANWTKVSIRYAIVW